MQTPVYTLLKFLLAAAIPLTVSPLAGAPSPQEVRSAAIDAYIYGYPLVTMEVSRRVMTNVAPGPGKESNWLPAPEGKFNLILRLYWPDETPPSILDGSWSPAAVKKVE